MSDSIIGSQTEGGLTSPNGVIMTNGSTVLASWPLNIARPFKLRAGVRSGATVTASILFSGDPLAQRP
jgi:hypothetical protein